MTEQPQFEFTPTRSFEEVLAAYEAADDLLDWLRGEVAEFLSGGEVVEDIDERVDELLEVLEDRREDLQATVRDPDALLGVEVEVLGPAGTRAMVLTEVPHAVELLWTVANYADPGDTVRVTHHYTDNVVCASRLWPFGVEDAVLLTSPDARALSLPADPDDDTCDVELDVAVPSAATVALVAVCVTVGVALGRAFARRR